MKLNFSPVLALACALGLGTAAAFAAPYDVIVTPDQFNPLTWGGNLSQDTAGAYPGDDANGYYYTNNYGQHRPRRRLTFRCRPACLLEPTSTTCTSGYPTAHSVQWHVVDINADGTANNNPDHDPSDGYSLGRSVRHQSPIPARPAE